MRELVKAGTAPIPDADLHRLEVPTALLWSRRHDRSVSLALAETARAAFGGPLRVIDDAGHSPHIEPSHEFLAEVSRSWQVRSTGLLGLLGQGG
jgi:pimeloyl-ACP methyl ester carboxylesterase